MEQTSIKKETSIDWLMAQLYKKGFIKEVDGNEPINLMNQAKEMENQQQGYSEEEFLEFSEWVSHNDWVYLPSKGYWVNEEQEESEQKFTTKELLEIFKNK